MIVPSCDAKFTSTATYHRALERAIHLGFESVYEAVNTKVRAGEPVQTVADKLDVSWNTIDRWMKASGIPPNKNPRKRIWWLIPEDYLKKVERLKR